MTELKNIRKTYRLKIVDKQLYKWKNATNKK